MQSDEVVRVVINLRAVAFQQWEMVIAKLSKEFGPKGFQGIPVGSWYRG